MCQLVDQPLFAGQPVDTSRRIVHALHATLQRLRVSAWFDYVRSKANVSDEPSREPRLDSAIMRVERRVVSERVSRGSSFSPRAAGVGLGGGRLGTSG